MSEMCEPNSEKASEISAESPTTPVGAQPVETAEPKSSERVKATRHPRWTRQETLVLIEAKKVIENGDQVCRYRSSTSGLVQTDPKWDLVSSLCQQHGVKRGAVQCRKRWGNLLTDFRKIKKWESNIKDESESFWIMRNDVRKENKLPGFFDSVVYNVLDGGVCTAAAFPLTLIKMMPRAENGDQVEGVPALEQCNKEDENEEDEDEAIVDSDKMEWSTEEENNETNIMVNSPFKAPNAKKSNIVGGLKVTPPPPITLPGSAERPPHPFFQGNYDPGCQREALFNEGYKRKRLSSDNSEDTADFNEDVIKVLRRNSNILKTHLGAQNMNSQLARDQQKQQNDSLVAALGRLTDAITKIADKM
ncbi:putative transcription factor MYB-HB-like family [Medicago truncatula]|uniref:Myb/SANT-like DNA-binding domain protein n=1 Tax=Medicago truncatula TaxID=3880 RepID=G7LIU0_MEDTR|nr:trihelix transcription factor ASR3 [Medicago truncatula]AET05068.1 myb/SANT-like DNA-binding domain protein [Medicago truncatula]RHN43248.1 putative transcription factor MYB-HB-like family [Medicago truncatula]